MRVGMMADKIPWILAGVLALVVLLGAVFWYAYRGKKRPETNYKTLFFVGLCWLAIGVPLGNMALGGIGIVFIAMGLANRDKWKGEKSWGKLSEEERKRKLWLTVALLALVVLGAIAFFYLGWRAAG